MNRCMLGRFTCPKGTEVFHPSGATVGFRRNSHMYNHSHRKVYYHCYDITIDNITINAITHFSTIFFFTKISFQSFLSASKLCKPVNWYWQNCSLIASSKWIDGSYLSLGCTFQFSIYVLFGVLAVIFLWGFYFIICYLCVDIIRLS